MVKTSFDILKEEINISLISLAKALKLKNRLAAQAVDTRLANP